MSQRDYIEPEALPDLQLPEGDKIVDVFIINTTTTIVGKASSFVQPTLKGHEYLSIPTFAFYIRHPSGKEILFDSGARKDYWNLSPSAFAGIRKGIPGLEVQKNVNEILTEGGVNLDSISALIWSHWHWDHTGDPSQYPKGANLVVGPDFKAKILPGYPTNKDSGILDSDVEGRKIIELDFSDGFKIGKFQAHDYFCDGSFYLLNSPGHAIGHICGLARTTATTFVLLGADVCHFGGTFRPSQYAPMPKTIPEDVPLDLNRFWVPCPCSVFTACHPNQGNEQTSPYYQVSHAKESLYSDPPLAQQSVVALADFDAHPDVFVCIGHDEGLLPVVDWFPDATLNHWKEKGWKTKTQWGFLNALPIDGKPAKGDVLKLGLRKDGQRMTEWEETS